jgi:hypothetical protein
VVDEKEIPPPPPTDVIVEKTEFDPFTAFTLDVVAAAPPPPTVTV